MLKAGGNKSGGPGGSSVSDNYESHARTPYYYYLFLGPHPMIPMNLPSVLVPTQPRALKDVIDFFFKLKKQSCLNKT